MRNYVVRWCANAMALGTLTACTATTGPSSVAGDGGNRDGTVNAADAGPAGDGSEAPDTGGSGAGDAGAASGSADAGEDAAPPLAPVSDCIQDGGTYVPNQTPCTGPGRECWNGACVTPMQSCLPGGPGMTNCGPSGTDSCCANLWVDGGAFDRTFTNSGSGPTGGADPADVSSFRLDKYLVTVGRFRQFVNAWSGGAGWFPPAGSGRHAHLNGGLGLSNGAAGDAGQAYEPGWASADDGTVAIEPTAGNFATCGAAFTTWEDAGSGPRENLPINCVTWQEAYAFCIWDGAFLPSENEWEYAAYGGANESEYPWGNTGGASPTSAYAIYNCLYNPSTNCTTVAAIAPVGAAPLGAGLWGQMDLVGELWEWELDWEHPYASPCTDCAAVGSGTGRAVRGGPFGFAASYLLSGARNTFAPTARGKITGFRCARTP